MPASTKRGKEEEVARTVYGKREEEWAKRELEKKMLLSRLPSQRPVCPYVATEERARNSYLISPFLSSAWLRERINLHIFRCGEELGVGAWGVS